MRNNKPKGIFKNRKTLCSGFTLIEIMVVVGIIGVLAAISIPAFSKSRTCTGNTCCINNLRLIYYAKNQYIITSEINVITNEISFNSGVNEYIKGGAPHCPQGGTYSYGDLESLPSCSIPNHILDTSK